MRAHLLTALCVGLGLFPATVHAQEYMIEETRSPRFLVEATGGWGFQLGETEYLPDGSATEYQHPLVNGYAVGGTAGLMLMEQVALVVSYEYTNATSSEGDITGALDRVEGYIDYHSTVIGLRLYQPTGFGRLRLEFGIGVMFPHETRLELEYADTLQALGISGTGTRVSNYSWGVGGQALAGYEVPLGDVFYVAANLKYKLFQTTNKGETTELRNFVDLEAEVPMPVDATITHDDGAARPTTNSVQDVRLQLAVGVRF